MDVIYMYIKGEEYNPMFKWNNFAELKQAVESGENVPAMDSLVVEAYVLDNLVDCGNTFDVTYNKLKLMYDYD